ncbi:hypothetical protein TRSC58_07368 [Trypanosoma rangeli SC58]|uniref:Uncharacterized protein n=1 Tax=Trypanosoma rangeli SC58 TaxID=429131 RepID=A0A061IS21_TRYRA|nr:hypothetical protein TRSC58_07368 [Trypanosoma rangeli SC58]
MSQRPLRFQPYLLLRFCLPSFPVPAWWQVCERSAHTGSTGPCCLPCGAAAVVSLHAGVPPTSACLAPVPPLGGLLLRCNSALDLYATTSDEKGNAQVAGNKVQSACLKESGGRQAAAPHFTENNNNIETGKQNKTKQHFLPELSKLSPSHYTRHATLLLFLVVVVYIYIYMGMRVRISVNVASPPTQKYEGQRGRGDASDATYTHTNNPSAKPCKKKKRSYKPFSQ